MTILEIYNTVKEKYRARSEIVGPEDLKVKLSTLIRDTDKEYRDKISEIIIGLIWANSDDLPRDKTERLWISCGKSAIKIPLAQLIPCTRGILSLFVDMYRAGDLNKFYGP